MKRIRAACLLQTICFQPKDDEPAEYGKQKVRQEYETYKTQMPQRGTAFKILEEVAQPDGSIVVKLKKQYNQQAVGDYFD